MSNPNLTFTAVPVNNMRVKLQEDVLEGMDAPPEVTGEGQVLALGIICGDLSAVGKMPYSFWMDALNHNLVYLILLDGASFPTWWPEHDLQGVHSEK